MPVDLTDEEVICGFMEPKPSAFAWTEPSPGGWWQGGSHVVQCGLLKFVWRPSLDTCAEIEKLGRLHWVEERLTGEQWDRYWDALRRIVYPLNEKTTRGLIHASAEQKRKALAAVLREEKANG